MTKKLGLAVLTAGVVAAAGMGFKNFINPYETVYKIADGDTVIIEPHKQTIRLFGINSPETDQCYGKEASERLSELLSKKKIQLKDPLVDKFRRIVALVYVDGKLINEIMIREGFAAYEAKPGSEQAVMKSAHEYAKANKIGIYSSTCTDDAPPNPKCAIKGNHDLDRDAKVYLLPTCSHYNIVNVRRFEGDTWFCTESEAKKAGFKISPDCTINWSGYLNPSK